MKRIIRNIFMVLICLGAGIAAYKNLHSRFFMEEYYFVQNLDPDNEKNAEEFRQKIRRLMQKTVPSRHRPHPDQFQCFKIISEAVFFCSVETHRKRVADSMRELLQETIPQEMGWLSMEEAMGNVSDLKEELAGNTGLIRDMTAQLDKISKKSVSRRELQKFSRTNELYKKNLELMRKKIDVLRDLIAETPEGDIRETHQFTLDDGQEDFDSVQIEYSGFRQKNKDLAEAEEQIEVLTREIDDLKEKNSKVQRHLELAEKALSSPNVIGKVADMNEFQLISDPNRQKFEAQRNTANFLWFTIFMFFVLSNFIFRLQPRTLTPFQEDPTMTIGL